MRRERGGKNKSRDRDRRKKTEAEGGKENQREKKSEGKKDTASQRKLSKAQRSHMLTNRSHAHKGHTRSQTDHMHMKVTHRNATQGLCNKMPGMALQIWEFPSLHQATKGGTSMTLTKCAQRFFHFLSKLDPRCDRNVLSTCQLFLLRLTMLKLAVNVMLLLISIHSFSMQGPCRAAGVWSLS